MRNLTNLALVAALPMLAFDGENAEAAAGTAAQPDNTFVFPIPNAKDGDGNDVQISVDLAAIPAEVRMDMLKNAVKAYVTNSVNQENVRTNKKLEPFTAYEAATAADPLQTAVPKPEGERPVADLIGTAAAARERLYKGEIRKQGVTKARETKDPLIKLVTDAVLREVFEKNKAANSTYKWTDAVKEVGGDGKAYLEKLIASKVAKGADKDALDKAMQERFIKPAEMMLGRRDNKATKDTDLL